MQTIKTVTNCDVRTAPDAEQRIERLRQRLETRFNPLELEIQDDGAQHAGHAHAGGGHYSVRIIAPAFATQSLLRRHRMIYAALDDMLQTDIHALSIKALAPGELH